jgi:hypothetical protein
MSHHQGPSPLQPDPPGREDIMSDEPREAAAVRHAGDAPRPRDAAGREDVLREEPRDLTADDG